jgi:hypothetical protein
MDQNRERARNNGNLGSAIRRSIGGLEGLDIEQIRERFVDLNERVVELIRERPGTSLLVALGAGYLIGRILRA